MNGYDIYIIRNNKWIFFKQIKEKKIANKIKNALKDQGIKAKIVKIPEYHTGRTIEYFRTRQINKKI